jgi:hypothetical protein
MPLYLQPGLRVRIQTFVGQQPLTPLPVLSGFTEGGIYLVIGAIEHSPDGELWLILANDRDELWRISNRHCRYVKDCMSLGVDNQ